MKSRIFLIAIVLFSVYSVKAQDTTQLMFYNVLSFPGSRDGRMPYLTKIVGEVKPDIMMVCELEDASAGTAILNNALNVNGVSSYRRSTYWDDSYLGNMLYYDSDIFSMLQQDTLFGNPRATTVYKLLHKPSHSIGDSLVYTVLITHFKAGQGGGNAKDRNQSANRIRRYINQKAQGENVILGGDLNVYSGDEDAFKTLTASEGNRLYDPIGKIGNWHNNNQYAPQHTQSTRTTSFGGGSAGGFDDRFDFILLSRDIIRGEKGLRYVAHSYQAFGQDGNRFNRSLVFGVHANVDADLANALHEMSDHLPVIAKLWVMNQNAGQSVPNWEDQTHLQVEGRAIFWQNDESGTLRIMDLNGRLIEQMAVSANGHLPLRQLGLTPGIYVAQYQCHDGIEIVKFQWTE